MISVILPTYNEARNIKALITEIRNHLDNPEIIVVDDNSPDGTAAIAKKAGAKVLIRKKKLGLSSAIWAGIRKSSGTTLCIMDADMSHPPEVLPKMISLLGKHDLVIGSRLAKGGGVKRWPAHRRIISQVATSMARVLVDARDPMSGFFVMKRDVAKDLDIQSQGYKILLEILVKKRPSFREVPYIFENRVHGSSKLNTMEYVKYTYDWLRLLPWNFR